jgi:hypothetical protein
MSTLYIDDFPKNNQSIVTGFTFRHILENTDHYLVEVRNDFLFDGIVEANFQWLKIAKDLKEVAPLHLKAQDSSWDIEERFFDEGYLKFGQQTGIFIEKFNSGQHQYQHLEKDIETKFKAVLHAYYDNGKVLVN